MFFEKDPQKYQMYEDLISKTESTSKKDIIEYYRQNKYFKRVLDDFKNNIDAPKNGIIDDEPVRRKLLETCQKITGEKTRGR